MRGGMLGYSEQITEDDMYCNGITGKEMHNWGHTGTQRFMVRQRGKS